MNDFSKLGMDELVEAKSNLEERYRDFLARNLNLDMTRGKPCPEQLDLSLDMLTAVKEGSFSSRDGVDCRNYGGLDGLPEAKELFSEFLGVATDEIIIGGNASLKMMHDALMTAVVHGATKGDIPWKELPKVKFLCPVPGYDRHFALCEYLGMEMISVGMDENGPDMDEVEKRVTEDEAVKGIWCVPKYSNPSGASYSDEVVDRMAGMKTAAKDFRIFWDNAYTVHHLTDDPPVLKNILAACKEAGNPERVFIFGSTSKVSFAGAGVAMMGASRENIDYMKKQLFFQTIGPDKLNQLRHVMFFENMEGIENHMKKHQAILKPKFDAVEEVLERELGGKNIAEWSKPAGGYFVSLDTMDGCAGAVVEMAAKAGAKLTPAGSTHPLKNDPADRNIRLAPSFPPVEDIVVAMELLAVCIQLVSIDKLMEKGESQAG